MERQDLRGGGKTHEAGGNLNACGSLKSVRRAGLLIEKTVIAFANKKRIINCGKAETRHRPSRRESELHRKKKEDGSLGEFRHAKKSGP